MLAATTSCFVRYEPVSCLVFDEDEDDEIASCFVCRETGLENYMDAEEPRDEAQEMHLAATMSELTTTMLLHETFVARVVLVGFDVGRVVDRWVLNDPVGGDKVLAKAAAAQDHHHHQHGGGGENANDATATPKKSYRHTKVRLVTKSYALNIILDEYSRPEDDALRRYMASCSGAVVVADLAHRETLHAAAGWFDYFKDHALPAVLVVTGDDGADDADVDAIGQAHWFRLHHNDLEPLSYLADRIVEARRGGDEHFPRPPRVVSQQQQHQKGPPRGGVVKAARGVGPRSSSSSTTTTPPLGKEEEGGKTTRSLPLGAEKDEDDDDEKQEE